MSQQLIYILLGVAVLIMAFTIIRDWIGQKKGKDSDAPVPDGTDNSEIALPLRLQAYERLVVLLERINPEHLTGRVLAPNMKVQDVRSLMIHSIKAEYDHNLSQQIYVSTAAWEAVSNAKEQMISLINSLAEKMDPEADGKILGKQLLQLSLKEKELPTRTALQVVNSEAKKLFTYRGANKSALFQHD